VRDKELKDKNRIQYTHPHILFYQSYNFPAAVTSLTARYIILHYPDGRKRASEEKTQSNKKQDKHDKINKMKREIRKFKLKRNIEKLEVVKE